MKRTATIVEIGTSKIVALIGEKRSADRLDILGTGIIPYGGLRKGVWQEPEALADCLRRAVEEAENAAHRKARDIYIGVPDEFIRVDVINASVMVGNKDHVVDEDAVESLIEQAEQDLPFDDYQVLHRSPCYFVLDSGERTPDPLDAETQMLSGTVSFVSAKQTFVMLLDDLAQTVGLQIAGYYSIAYSEMLYLLTPEERDVTFILLDVGYYSSSLSVVIGDGLAFHQQIPLGGFQVASDLAYCFDIPYEQAEQLKRRFVFGLDVQNAQDSGVDIIVEGRNVRISDKYIQNIIEARVEEIGDLIKHALFAYNGEVGANVSIGLTGGGLSLMRGVREYLSQVTGHPVRILAPQSSHLNNPMFSGAMSLLDSVLTDPGASGHHHHRGTGVLKSMFGRIADFFYE